MDEVGEEIGFPMEAAFFRDGAIVLVIGIVLGNHIPKSITRPWLLMAKIHAHTQDEHGFPTPDEQPTLDALMAPWRHIVEKSGSQSIGRISTKGTRAFYIYAKNGPELANELIDAYRSRPDYVIDVECTNDPEWRFYSEEIAPLQTYNREREKLNLVLGELQKSGDDLSEARRFDHGLRFPSSQAAKAFLEWVITRGFSASGLPQEDSKSAEFSVDIHRVEVPGSKFLFGTLYELVIGANRFGGTYSSNGCFAITKNSSKAGA